jgi:hypothetical protein
MCTYHALSGFPNSSDATWSRLPLKMKTCCRSKSGGSFWHTGAASIGLESSHIQTPPVPKDIDGTLAMNPLIQRVINMAASAEKKTGEN